MARQFIQLKNTESSTLNFLLDKLKQNRGIKINISLKLTFMKQDEKKNKMATSKQSLGK